MNDSCMCLSTKCCYTRHTHTHTHTHRHTESLIKTDETAHTLLLTSRLLMRQRGQRLQKHQLCVCVCVCNFHFISFVTAVFFFSDKDKCILILFFFSILFFPHVSFQEDSHWKTSALFIIFPSY